MPRETEIKQKEELSQTGLDSIYAPEPQTSISDASKLASQQELEALGLADATRKNLHGLINRAILWGGHILLAGAMLILICRIAHFIIPEELQWLDDSRLKEIDHLILGLMTGLATRFWPNGKRNGD
jgi:hypothetical protein